MGKKDNALFVLMTIGADIGMGIAWYVTLYPKETTTTIGAVGSGVFLTLLTLLMLVMNYAAYDTAIKDGS